MCSGFSLVRFPAAPGVRIILARIGGVALALVVAGCGSDPVAPTPPPPPNPPTIACPVSQTAQSPDGAPVAVQYLPPTVAAGAPPVAVACSPASGSQFNVGESNVTCTATDAYQRASTCTFTVAVQAPPPRLLATSFVAFGDSITWGEDGFEALNARLAGTQRPRVRVPISETYPDVLRQLLVGRYTTQTPTVDNAGNSGEKVTDATAFPRFVSLTSSSRYEVVLIMEGSNDLVAYGESMTEAAIDVLRQMIGDAKSRNMRPYLATVPPQDPAGFRGGSAAFVPGFNDMVRQLASEESVPLADVYTALAGNLATYIGSDGLHPTAAGYAKIADTFFTVIEKTLETHALWTNSGPRSVGFVAPSSSDRRSAAAGDVRAPAAKARADIRKMP
jgi:lysophospholipase L1-like esterase